MKKLAELPTNGLIGPSTPNTNFPTPARPPQLARTTKGPTAQCRRHRHFTIIPNSKVRRGGGGRISLNQSPQPHPRKKLQLSSCKGHFRTFAMLYEMWLWRSGIKKEAFPRSQIGPKPYTSLTRAESSELKSRASKLGVDATSHVAGTLTANRHS